MKYILQKKDDKVFSYLLDEGGHAVEIHVDRPADGPKLGDIYIGLVQKVARNINAAFVEILPGMNGYLPFDEIVEPIYTVKGPSPQIQAGDQLVVQISRDAFGEKDVSLTTKIAMRGKYAVLTSGGMGLGISQRIPEEKRTALKNMVMSSEEFADIQKRIGQCGIVIRTNASVALSERDNEGVSDKKKPENENNRSSNHNPSRRILAELSLLEAQQLDLKLKAPYRSVHTNLVKQPPRWLDRIIHLPEETIDSVITDDLSLYRQILKAADQAPEQIKKREPAGEELNIRIMRTSGAEYANPKYRLYDDPQVPMEKLFSLERELERAMARKVNLKSGGDLVIESTEALHVIDVNSGRAKSGKHQEKEEALLKVNLEAAKEACRQIRLRNLSGIILIDFINLREASHSLRIIEELRREAAKDPIRTQVIDMTKLGLVEMTRQKIELPLSECI